MGITETRSKSTTNRHVLFLQGPISPFFRLIADRLEQQGHRVLRINLAFGDWLFWRRAGAVSYHGRLSDWPSYIDTFMRTNQVTDLVLLGEQREYHKIAINTARALGVDVTVTDFGYLRPDWITFERNGMTGDSLFPKSPDQIREIARSVPPPDLSRKYEDHFWRQVFWDMAYHLSSSLMRPLYPFFRWHHVHHPVFVYIGTGLHILRNKLHRKSTRRTVTDLVESGQPYYVFPLQMQNDFSIRAYSPFNDLRTAIDQVITSFTRHAGPDACLVIKLHPLDPGLHNWKRYVQMAAARSGQASRIIFLDGGPLEALLAHTRGVVTINSTVGIWTLLAGKPLIALGQAMYDVEGLVHRGNLDSFWKNSSAPDPALRDAFIRAITGTIQIRGVYYNQPGLNAAVEEATRRLAGGYINVPLPQLSQLR